MNNIFKIITLNKIKLVKKLYLKSRKIFVFFIFENGGNAVYYRITNV